MKTPSNAPELRPLEMGGLVDRAASFWRTHFGTLFRLYLGYQLVAFALMKTYSLAVQHFLPVFGGGPQLREAVKAEPIQAMTQLGLGLLAMTAMGALVWWLSWLVGVAGTRYAVDRLLGRPASLEAALRRAGQRVGTTTLAFLLSILWGIGITLLCLLPGAVFLGGAYASRESPLAAGGLAIVGVLLAGLGYLLAILWYILRFLLTPQVLAMEDVGAVAAMGRSGELISGRIGPGFLNRVKVRATILVTAVSMVLIAVTVVAGLPALLIQAVYGHVFDPARSDPGAIPQALLIPAELLQVGVQAAFSPLFVLFCALFYVDMRVRREGLDLELKLGSLAASTESPER